MLTMKVLETSFSRLNFESSVCLSFKTRKESRANRFEIHSSFRLINCFSLWSFEFLKVSQVKETRNETREIKKINVSNQWKGDRNSSWFHHKMKRVCPYSASLILISRGKEIMMKMKEDEMKKKQMFVPRRSFIPCLVLRSLLLTLVWSWTSRMLLTILFSDDAIDERKDERKIQISWEGKDNDPLKSIVLYDRQEEG